jgi:hypothetical protein
MLVLRATARDRDGGLRRVAVKGTLRVFCSEEGRPVRQEDEIDEEDREDLVVGDEAPISRFVTVTVSPTDIPPLCPAHSALVRSEGVFSAEAENAHGLVVTTPSFTYVDSGGR